MQAKLEALQLRLDKQMDQQKATTKAVQAQSCSLCGEESHDYNSYPLRQPEEEDEHVNSINDEPSFFPRPPFLRSYSSDPADRQS